MFENLARMVNMGPWVVVGVAIVFAALSGVFGGPVSKSLQAGGFQDPTSQSSQALERLEQGVATRELIRGAKVRRTIAANATPSRRG